MKTQITLFIAFSFCLSLITKAQPQKHTLELGGSGYYIRSKSSEGDKLKVFEIRPEVQYFLFKNFAIGGAVNIKGHKDYSLANNDLFYGIFLSPSIEGYLLNHKLFGLSVKGSMNIVVSTNYDITKDVSSYSLGPKASLNITPSLSTYIWLAYRKLEDFDDTMGFTSKIPSDNFDIRWGFSYFLHPKKDKE